LEALSIYLVEPVRDRGLVAGIAFGIINSLQYQHSISPHCTPYQFRTVLV